MIWTLTGMERIRPSYPPSFNMVILQEQLPLFLFWDLVAGQRSALSVPHDELTTRICKSSLTEHDNVIMLTSMCGGLARTDINQGESLLLQYDHINEGGYDGLMSVPCQLKSRVNVSHTNS